MTRRNAQLAALHIAAKAAGIEGEEYRDALEAVTGRRSAARLSSAGLDKAINHFSGGAPRRRWKPDPPAEKAKQIGKIRALLYDAGRVEAYAEAILQRLTGSEHRVPLAWATNKQLQGVIAALEYDRRRRANREGGTE